jgi:hypothetical protein
LKGFNRILGRKFSHHQCEFAVGSHLDGGRINSLHIGRGASTAAANSYHKFDVFHDFSFLRLIVFRKGSGEAREYPKPCRQNSSDGRTFYNDDAPRGGLRDGQN